MIPAMEKFDLIIVVNSGNGWVVIDFSLYWFQGAARVNCRDVTVQ